MIKLFQNGKLKKQYNGVYIKNIKDCAIVLKIERIEVKYPGKNLMTVARLSGYNLQGF